MIARVVPLTRTRAVRGAFDYRLGERHGGVRSWLGAADPLGRQRTLGVVVELAERSDLDPERLVEPDEQLEVSIPPDLVALAGWMAREYCSTIARALQLMLAPGTTSGLGQRRALVAELTPAGGEALMQDGAVRLTLRQRALLEALRRSGQTAASELGTESLRRLQARGLVAIESRVRRGARSRARSGWPRRWRLR